MKCLAVTSNIRNTPVHSVLQLLVTANVVLSSLIIFTLMMEAIRSSETSVLTRATRHHIPEDGILHEMYVFLELISNSMGGQWHCAFALRVHLCPCSANHDWTTNTSGLIGKIFQYPYPD
jgi:hypothetical protein